jgi:hypothetical protein
MTAETKAEIREAIREEFPAPIRAWLRPIRPQFEAMVDAWNEPLSEMTLRDAMGTATVISYIMLTTAVGVRILRNLIR